jgi:tetratricopeptide (TPR) repeat protein/ferredoxin
MKPGCGPDGVRRPRSKSLPIITNSSDDTPGVRRSKTSRWRAAALITLTALMVVHFIQWRIMGTTVSPIEPSESMYTLQNGAINAGFIFFTLAILATLIFGRFVCGWGCHIVALQDLCAWILKKLGLKPKPFRSRLLVYVPLVAALYMFVWPTLYRAIFRPAGLPIIPEFTNHLITTEFWATFPPFWVAVPFLFICGFVTVYFLGQKGFCTYGCPYGGFFAVADKVAPGKIRVTDACNQCGHCTATCMSNVQVHAEVAKYGMVIDPGCMKHMDCISVCPNDALYFGFGRPTVAVPKGGTSNYSLTWPEEIAGLIIFAASYFAVWNVYQLVPMLMALGIAIVTTFLALKSWRLLGRGDQAFYGWALRAGGSLKPAGVLFLIFSAFWIGVNAHSGFVLYHESKGNRAFESLRIPDELALAHADPAEWLTPEDRANINTGRHHLGIALRYGLFTNAFALPKVAWFDHLSGESERAVTTLASAAERQDGQAKALSLYYRGAILNRNGRHQEALASLTAALVERPDLAVAREEQGEAYWKLVRPEDAVKAWRAAVEQNPRLPLSLLFLSGAYAAAGRTADAEQFETTADQLTPKDAYFYWVLGSRLKGVEMNGLAEKNFARAVELNPSLMLRMSRSGTVPK